MMNSSNAKINLIFSILEKVSRALLTFVSLVFVGRYIGPEEYGKLNYLIAIVTYFQIFGVFGLDQILVGMFVREGENKGILFWQSFLFKVWMSVLSLVTYIIFLYLNGSIGWESLLFGITILSPVLDNKRLYLEAKNNHALVSKVDFVFQIISAAAKIVCIVFKLPFSIIFILFALDFILPKLSLFYISKDNALMNSFSKVSFTKQSFKGFLSAGFYHCFSAFFAIIYMKIDQVMVGNMLGMKELGNYSAAVRLSDAWYFLPVVVASVFFPNSVKESHSRKYSQSLQLIFDLTLWISLIVVGFSFLFNEEIYQLLFGDEYHVDKTVLNLLFISGILISLSISTNAWLNIKGSKEVVAIRTLAGALTNIGLNLLWIPEYGLVGCAWATVISYMVTFLLTFIAKDPLECSYYLLSSLNVSKAFQRFKLFLMGKM